MTDQQAYVRAIALLGIVLLALALGCTAFQAAISIEMAQGCSTSFVDPEDDPAFQACQSRQNLGWALGDLARPLLVGALLSGIAFLVVLARLRARQPVGPVIR